MIADHPAAQGALKALDTASLLVTVAAFAKVLPALAALLSCVWYLIRIGEWTVTKLRRRAQPTCPADD